MVKLIVNDFEQMNLLEWLLMLHGIEYKCYVSLVDIGLYPPYLVVDGVPLDFERSIKWIGEHGE